MQIIRLMDVIPCSRAQICRRFSFLLWKNFGCCFWSE